MHRSICQMGFTTEKLFKFKQYFIIMSYDGPQPLQYFIFFVAFFFISSIVSINIHYCLILSLIDINIYYALCVCVVLLLFLFILHVYFLGFRN